MLGSLAEHQETQCLASQNLEGYEAVGRAFPVCNNLTKESAAMLWSRWYAGLSSDLLMSLIYETCVYTKLGVGAWGCSFVAVEDLCCAATQHWMVCGFLATNPANTARVLLTKLGRDWLDSLVASISFDTPPLLLSFSPQVIPGPVVDFLHHPSSTILKATKKRKMAQTFSHNIGSFNTINNVTATDERSNILAWLSPLEPRLRHRDIQDRRVENIGGWVLETEAFKGWYASSGGSGSDNAVLFCYGDPGAGKTFIRY